MLQKKIKGEWFLLYGIEVYIPYRIGEGTVAIYGFFSLANHEGQTIRESRRGFLK